MDDNNTEYGANKNHEENLVLTSVITDQVQQVTNNYGKSNFTFKMIEVEGKSGSYFINLVVKEYRDSYFICIMKYVPDLNWIKTYVDESSFSSFTGDIYFYSDNGSYIAKTSMGNGVSTSISKHPCDEEDDDDSDSGGGTTDSGGDGNSGTDGTGSEEGTGGYGIECIVIEIFWDENCQCQYAVVSFCDDYFEDDKSFSDTLRHPCESLPEECYDSNGDPCSCNSEGNDCADGSDVNGHAGVIFNLQAYDDLLILAGESDEFQYGVELDPNDALEFENVDEFEVYLNTNSFDLDIPITENQDGSHTTTFKVSFLVTILDININQNLRDTTINQEYEINALNTIYSGATLGSSWNQSSYDYVLFNNTAIVDLYGEINYNLFIEGIGTIYTDVTHFQMIVDIETGEKLSIEKLD